MVFRTGSIAENVNSAHQRDRTGLEGPAESIANVAAEVGGGPVVLPELRIVAEREGGAPESPLEVPEITTQDD